MSGEVDKYAHIEFEGLLLSIFCLIEKRSSRSPTCYIKSLRACHSLCRRSAMKCSSSCGWVWKKLYQNFCEKADRFLLGNPRQKNVIPVTNKVTKCVNKGEDSLQGGKRISILGQWSMIAILVSGDLANKVLARNWIVSFCNLKGQLRPKGPKLCV